MFCLQILVAILALANHRLIFLTKPHRQAIWPKRAYALRDGRRPHPGAGKALLIPILYNSCGLPCFDRSPAMRHSPLEAWPIRAAAAPHEHAFLQACPVALNAADIKSVVEGGPILLDFTWPGQDPLIFSAPVAAIVHCQRAALPTFQVFDPLLPQAMQRRARRN